MNAQGGPVGTKFDVGKTTLEQCNEKYSFYTKVMQRLNEIGIPARQRPFVSPEHVAIFHDVTAGTAFDGRLPTVIRKLDLDQLSDLHALFSSWFAYVSYQERLADAQKTEANHKKIVTGAKLRDMYLIDGNGEKRSDEVIADLARADIRFIEADSFFAEMDALHSCLESAVRIASEDLKTISRELTRKQLVLERDTQKNRFSGKYTPRSEANYDDNETSDSGGSKGFQRKYSRGGT